MVEQRPWLTFLSHVVLIARRADRRLPALDDLRRLDPRPGDDAARADAAAARAASDRELQARCCSRATASASARTPVLH